VLVSKRQPMIKKLIAILFFNFVSLLWVNTAPSQQNIAIVKTTKDTVYLKNVYDPSEIILKYREVLENETKEHIEYLEKLYTVASAIFGGIGALFLALLYFQWGKNKKEIKNQVDENFKLKVDDIVKEQINQIDKLYKRKFNISTSWMNRIILELSEKAINQKDDKPLTSVNYEKLKGKLVLWVDDKPENNEQHIEVFKSMDVDFVIAKTTEEAKADIKKSNFDLIISNMGRPPKAGEVDNAEEGVVFIKYLKAIKSKIPIIIYTKPETQKKYGDIVVNEGVAITTGYTGLFKQILKYLAI
jgi:CheY-like chemotaxis protein